DAGGAFQRRAGADDGRSHLRRPLHAQHPGGVGLGRARHHQPGGVCRDGAGADRRPAAARPTAAARTPRLRERTDLRRGWLHAPRGGGVWRDVRSLADREPRAGGGMKLAFFGYAWGKALQPDAYMSETITSLAQTGADVDLYLGNELAKEYGIYGLNEKLRPERVGAF